MNDSQKKLKLLGKVITSRQWDLENLKIHQYEKQEKLQRAVADQNAVKQRIDEVESNMRQQSENRQNISLTHMQINRDFMLSQMNVLREKVQGCHAARQEYEEALTAVLDKHREVRLYEKVKDKKGAKLQMENTAMEFKELDDLWLQKKGKSHD